MIIHLQKYSPNPSLPKQHLKLLILLIFIVTFSLPAHAQNVKYGLKSGVSITNFYDSQFETENRTGFNFGGYMNIALKKIPLSVQPEISYSQRGSVSSWQIGDIIYNGTLKTDYIELPILAKYSLDRPRIVKPNLFIGLSGHLCLT